MNKSILIKKCKLEPISHTWYSMMKKKNRTNIEHVLIRFDDYPTAIVHIDTFWEGKGKDNYVHDKLSEGKQIECEIEFHYEEEEESGT